MNNKPALLIALQAAASAKGIDLSDIDVGTEFEWHGRRLRFTEQWVEFWSEDMNRWQREHGNAIVTLVQRPEAITAVHKWPEAEAKQARIDMECSCGFKWVSKDSDGDVKLWTNGATLDDESGNFFSVHSSWWTQKKR